MKNHMNNVEKFKETMKEGMIENFTRDGFLTPVYFILTEEGFPTIGIIPNEMISSSEGMDSVADCNTPLFSTKRSGELS